jgi:hypothetical protein
MPPRAARIEEGSGSDKFIEAARRMVETGQPKA